MNNSPAQCDPWCDVHWILEDDVVEITDSAEAADAAEEGGEVLEFWDQQLPASGALFPRLVSTLRLSQVPSECYLSPRNDRALLTADCAGHGRGQLHRLLRQLRQRARGASV